MLALCTSLPHQILDDLWEVIGHTDRTGNDTTDGVLNNIELSQRRANNVALELVNAIDWPASRIESRGVGSASPVIERDGDEPRNRRVEIKLRCPRESTR